MCSQAKEKANLLSSKNWIIQQRYEKKTWGNTTGWKCRKLSKRTKKWSVEIARCQYARNYTQNVRNVNNRNVEIDIYEIEQALTEMKAADKEGKTDIPEGRNESKVIILFEKEDKID